MCPIRCLNNGIDGHNQRSAAAQSPQKWVTSWTGSVQGPIPSATPRLISGGT
jgi:hypothetical protein